MKAEPGVQVLSPGFLVEELPVRLTNINNLVFAPDGRLFALGYDGRVHVLHDTNGDGLEDHADVFWDQPTFHVPVGMLWTPEGIYISSNGKVSLLRDDDKDGKADHEEIVASGWIGPDNPSGGVDAIGLARDPEGNLYFGLGCADYSNPYRVKDGTSRYDLQSERGTIVKLLRSGGRHATSAEGARFETKREILCTGVRFTYALKFNRAGDLFATDQEGETWLPGGNPLDELNHIVPGKHYGFPPRHEIYLPNAVDEPAVIAFGPQHQSSCGMVFDDSNDSQKRFGPPSWEGNAFVAGFSRGKIWRVQLVKTEGGYVGRSTLFATVRMLAADVTISPAGALYLTCHSGPPDWGTGPQGEGRLFKISYKDPAAPQPVLAWASGPLEARVAFDKALDPEAVKDFEQTVITFGEHVRAADRYEVFRPGYAVVKTQQESPRGTLRIVEASLEPGGRTVKLTTDPHPLPVTYALTLPAVRAADPTGLAGAGAGATVDLAYDLSGAEARWESEAGPTAESWSGCLPSIDLDVSRALSIGSAEHERLEGLLAKAGKLTLRTLLKLSRGTLVRLEASESFEAKLGSTETGSRLAGGVHRAEIKAGEASELTPLLVRLATGKERATLHAAYRRDVDTSWRPIPLDLQLLPWAPPRSRELPATPGAPPEIAAGDWARGEAVFFGEKAKCGVCHTMRGKGGRAGPDLSNLTHRDPASVLRDITEPSATINPDFVSYTIILRDQTVLSGLVRAEGADAVRITDSEAKERVLRRSEIEDLRPSATSIMPADLIKAIGEASLRDLLSYLLTSPPAQAGGAKPEKKASSGPLPRSRAEVQAALGTPPVPPVRKPRELKIVLVAGDQDHGPGEHDYPAWQKSWGKLLQEADGVQVFAAKDWPEKAQWERADLAVFYFWNHDWSVARYEDLDSFLARGGGLVFLHSATIADKEPEALALRLGLSAQPVRTKYRHGPLDLKIVTPTEHPITKGLSKIQLVDETYWPLIGDPSKVEVLATAEEEGKAWPMLWTWKKEKGRVFGSVLGHYSWTYNDPLFRLLILRGMAWAAGEAESRFEALATEGVLLEK